MEFGIPMKLVRLIKICLNETYSRVRVGKQSSDNGLKQGDALSSLLFDFVLEYVISMVQASQVGLTLNGAHQLLVYADYVIILGESMNRRQNFPPLQATKALRVGRGIALPFLRPRH
jgi:hypothetical protein